MTNAKDLSKGDEVSWKWGGSNPKGSVVEVVDDGQAKATTKSGKEMTKEGTKDNPAVVVKTASSGSQGIKKTSELNGVDA